MTTRCATVRSLAMAGFFAAVTLEFPHAVTAQAQEPKPPHGSSPQTSTSTQQTQATSGTGRDPVCGTPKDGTQHRVI
jgi:hypothetical protein